MSKFYNELNYKFTMLETRIDIQVESKTCILYEPTVIKYNLYIKKRRKKSIWLKIKKMSSPSSSTIQKYNI
jgi:hypothetical protein